ncbi:MAG TPA: LptF/LptG family permease, partial [Burkholderiaceae bacterium]|nr:LptF/LptG family permease [Burkholderiaceae bacterium]
ELGRTIRFLAENQQRTTQLEQAFYQKLFVPLSIIVMLLLALPFAFLQSRAGGVSTKMFAGILLGVLFHTLNRLFSHLGNLNTWPPFITAIAPLLLGLMLAGALLWWVQRTR